MNIIIVGCGKVGYTLVEQLSNEEHNIVVVDKNPDKVRYIADDLDTMGLLGMVSATRHYRKPELQPQIL